MTELPIKAYMVLNTDSSEGDIYFARHAVVARRLGAQQHADGEFGYVRCERAPWADKYAPKKPGWARVPFKEKFKWGWWQECSDCGQMIREDADEDDDGNEIPPFDIVENGDFVFCRPACHAHWKAERAETKRIEKEVIAELSETVMKLMPGALIWGSTHVYSPSGYTPRVTQQAYVQFAYPGMRWGLGQFRFDKAGEKPHVMVCGGDRIAFQRWQDLGYPPHMMDAPEV